MTVLLLSSALLYNVLLGYFDIRLQTQESTVSDFSRDQTVDF